MATATKDEKDERHLSAVDDGGNGEKTIEEIADEPDQQTAPTQMAIPGTRDRLVGKMGGLPPTDSELRIMGGKRPIIGQFDKGETITVISTGTIREAGEVDADDEWGTVTKTTRVHKMRQIQVQVATPAALMRELAKLGYDDKAKVGILFDEVFGD